MTHLVRVGGKVVNLDTVEVAEIGYEELADGARVPKVDVRFLSGAFKQFKGNDANRLLGAFDRLLVREERFRG